MKKEPIRLVFKFLDILLKGQVDDKDISDLRELNEFDYETYFEGFSMKDLTMFETIKNNIRILYLITSNLLNDLSLFCDKDYLNKLKFIINQSYQDLLILENNIK